jgi:hypothetical protein
MLFDKRIDLDRGASFLGVRLPIDDSTPLPDAHTAGK